MDYDFKNLNEIPVQDKPTENTTVMAFEGGVPKQIPAGEFGGKAFIFEISTDDYTVDDGNMTVTKNYDPLYDVLMSGGAAVIHFAASDDAPARYEVPVTWYTLENMGFMVILFEGLLRFANGSYHTTA